MPKERRPAPSDRASSGELLRAVEQGLAGDWEAAHAIAQAHEGHEIADWIHAVAHRMEGDLDNAGYWYRRCGRALDLQLSAADELRRIREALEK